MKCQKKKNQKKNKRKKPKPLPKNPKKKKLIMERTVQSVSTHCIDLAMVINTYTDGDFEQRSIERWVGLNIDDNRKEEIAKKILELRKLLHDK